MHDVRTAYHEAGHAVVAVALGYDVVSAVVSGDSGEVRYVLPRHMTDADRIMMAMGGEVAELVQYRRRDMRFGSLHDERIWRSFTAHLPADAEYRYLASCRRETRKLLRQHWPAVEQIARTLATTGSMSGDAIKRLIGE